MGANAQGKTNILEAIVLLLVGKSFRTSDHRDLISWWSASSTVAASLESPRGTDELVGILNQEGKEFCRNGKRTRPSGPACVLFAPEEILLIKNPPSMRRRYIDTFAAGFFPGHRKMVRDYEKTLAQRNRLLQDESIGTGERNELLDTWDRQLSTTGAELSISRARWIEFLNSELPAQYAAIAPRDGEAGFRYAPFCGEQGFSCKKAALAETILEQLGERRAEELIRRTTLAGPHRDDVTAEIGGSQLKRFGSQGQQRSFVLALKTAEMELHKKADGAAPLLLLDDVASELDQDRRGFLFDYLSRSQAQAFVTATQGGEVRRVLGAGCRTFVIEGGRARTGKNPP